MSTDPLGLAEDVDEATQRLLATAAGLDDAAVRAPSALPGWTRGHVLTHLARNADGAVNLLTWARTGVESPQYESWQRRVDDIEAGAGRPATELLGDLTTACARLRAAVAQMPPQAWSAQVRWTSGGQTPAAEVVWSRLREVEIHHVDLDAGYQPTDWPDAFTLRMARFLARVFGARADGPRLVLDLPEVGHPVPVGEGVASPVVTGPAWAAVAWLIGRSTGEQLTIEPAG
ncbi:MAG TPA: maleylpyruvate isomerase family mycothiol-dependent enzyme, partial [Micromonosporaceae bacterium]